MPPFSLSITIIPAMAILADILLYVFLMRHTKQKGMFNRFVITTILWAFFFNVAWEILQIPLFKGGVYGWQHILFWVKNLNIKRIILLLLTGGAGAVLVEIGHLSIGTWSYADAMPLIPFVNVGLSPVLQFMILPMLIYKLSFKMLEKKVEFN